MNKIITEHYERITRRKAETIFNNGGIVYALACRLHPENMWCAPCEVDPNTETSLSGFENAYIYYNCNSETGRKVAYYLKRE